MAARISEEVASTEADRYSRQMAALGVDTMRNLMGLTVLVVGVKGVGVETAKDLCLSGPKGVTVWDDDVATIADLGTNFYLQQSHVGVAKCSIVASSLAELNPYVEVKAHTGALTDRFLQSFGAVVITKHLPKADMLRINEVCRSSNVIFILALTYGASCLLFSDFGDHHKITDTDGETVDPMVIESIDQFGVVVCATEKHGLSDGDEVVLTECEGATWLNDLKSVKVKRVYTKERDLDAKGEQKKDSQGNLRWRNIAAQNKIQLDVADELKPRFSEWKNGGLIQYVKPIVDMQFKSLASSLNAPKTANEFFLHHLDDNRTYSGRGDQLQLAFTSLLEFEAKHGRRPALHSVEDANEMVLVARAVNDARKAAEQQSVEEVDADVITKFSLYNRAELSGFCAFLGGVVAQEVVKKFGKYTPVYQWLTVDYFELLQNAIPANANSIGSRYDHQIALFGKAIQDKILAQKWFMVGCGALGCEYMKAFAMMGVGAGKNGCVHITDADTIELSNLSRQFLFRSQHINRFKSVCAAEVVVGMNSDLNVVCHEIRVGPETENIFNDAFWMQFDGIWNALDNIQARLYTDSKCILYGKPLLESGTEGTKANSSVHIPGKTLSYGDLPVQETGKIAACTLRNFPHLIVHCIEWARPRFESMFVFLPKQVNTLLADEKKFFENTEKEGLADGIKSLQEMIALITLAKNRGYESCIQLAVNEFITQYRNRIKDLMFCFPEDCRNFRTSEDGTKLDLGPFWTGKKRFPQSAELDMSNDQHFNYIYHTTNLYAWMFGLESLSRQDLTRVYGSMSVVVAPWVEPQEIVDVSEDEKKQDANAPVDDTERQQFDTLKAQVSALIAGAPMGELRVTDFEKDDDTNFHIDFIASTSNMRAWNYRIKPTTRLKAKVIAGKIIAALASTTAMITGLTCLEFYKLVLGLEKDEKVNPYFDTNVNLAVAAFNSFEVQDAKKKATGFSELMNCEIKAVPEGFTPWDFTVINQGDLTFNQLLAALPQVHHGCEFETIQKYKITQEEIDAGKSGYLYDLNQPREDMDTKVTAAYEAIYGPIPPGRNFLLLDGDIALEDEPVFIPTIKYIFRQ